MCLRLGSIQERRGVARKLAAELIQRADTLMYDAKGLKSSYVHMTGVHVVNGKLVDIDGPRTDSVAS